MNRKIRRSIMHRKVSIVIILCLLILQVASAQQPGEISYHDESVFPSGKIGERIQALIDTVNANDPERVRQFVKEHFAEKFRDFAPMEQHIDVFLGFFRETGGIDFHSIRTYNPERKGETVVVLKDRLLDNWMALVLRFDEKNDFLISGASFNTARTPSNVKESNITEAQFLQEVKDTMQRLTKADVFSGTLLIAKGDKVLMTFVGGEASKRFHVPNNMDTKFNLGSMNKMFTATSIMQLVEKGRLALDDPISKYVDESWLPEEITSKITIHHLLTHTSGLGSYFNETYMKGSRELFRYVEDFKPLVKVEKPAFEPGERFRYSNTGMLLLGVVIESVTGQSYFDYVRKNIYEPAGMKDTDSFEMDYPVENLAIGYSPAPNSPYGWKNNLYEHVIKGGPAGGGFSTVGDLHRFGLALLSGKLVSKESMDKMWTDHAGENYGYGFRISEGSFGKAVGHSGGFSGINGNLSLFLDKGYIAAVLSNYSRGASPVARKIEDLIARIE
jgi:CubicO group peptidase (beta-lactamase class C family)